MEDDVRFSIVIPAFNAAKYIGCCIDSILSQDYCNFELIIVSDEMSTDDTNTILREYEEKDERIKVYPRGHNGPSDARNYGIEVSTGEYVIFVDADDFFCDNCYLSEIKKGVDKSNPDLIVTKYKKSTEDGSQMYDVGSSWDEEYENADEKTKLAYALNTGYFNISPWGKAVKKSYMVDNSIYFPDGYCEDTDWTSRLIQNPEGVELVNCDALVHRVCADSRSHHMSVKQIRDSITRIYDWKERINGEGEFCKAQLGHLSYLYFILLADIYFLTKKSERKIFEEDVNNLSYLVDYAVSKKTRLSRMVCKIFGMKAGGYILHIYLRVRKL